MGQSPEAAAKDVGVGVDASNSEKSKDVGKMVVIDDIDDDVVRGSGCWFFRSFGCLSKRANADGGGASGASSQNAESKSTYDSSNEQPVAPIGSSTTSNAESNPSTVNISQELKISSQLRNFTYNELKLATRNFRADSVLGEGGFGCVYKGWVNATGNTPVKPGTGITVAVKTLNHDGLQGHKEWLAEVNYLGELVHPNLVKLIGYCIEDDQRLLVYEFMPRGSLENHLFKTPPPPQQHLHDASGLMISGDLLHPHQSHEVMSDDCWPNIIPPTEKKRRLNPDQVKALEKKFESSSSSSSSRNRLDTDTKLHLARELGLHPRQVAVWFQNRRARWKTKKLEKDYDALRRQVDSLRADNDALKSQNRKLHSQLQLLAFKGKDDDVLPTAGPTTIIGGPGAPNQFPGSREGFCNNMFGENQSHHQGFWPWPDHHLSFH